MTQIQQITADTLQQFNFSLDDGTVVTITIYFRPMQFGWFINNITYGSFVLNGTRIVVSPNMLNQFRNQIPFGLACLVDGNREPTQQEDFASGAARLYVLNKAEVNQFAEILSG